MTAHHDKSGDILLSDDLEIAWDAHLHNFDMCMAEGNMLMNLETQFDYNQNASERQFLGNFSVAVGTASEGSGSYYPLRLSQLMTSAIV